MIELTAVLLTVACGFIFYLILKDCIRDYRTAAREDKQYRLAISYIRRHHRHGGEIPTPADMWLHGRIKREIAIEAYEDYTKGVIEE